jgi:hypothetical protein
MIFFVQTRSSYGTRTPQIDRLTSPFEVSSTNQMVTNYQLRQQQQPRM